MHAERYAMRGRDGGGDRARAPPGSPRSGGGHHRGTRARIGRADGRRASRPVRGETRLFIHPGYRFRVIDALLTNFHLPQSTLLMLVAALAGRELVLAAYAHAVRERYRFFSYGDAMLVFPAQRRPPRAFGVSTQPLRFELLATDGGRSPGAPQSAARRDRHAGLHAGRHLWDRQGDDARGARDARRADRAGQYVSSDAAARSRDRGSASRAGCTASWAGSTRS